MEDTGFRVITDDRNEYTSGWKFNEWELKGVPLRINIGNREIESGSVELVRRDNMDKTHVSCDDLPSHELKSIIDKKGGFVFCGWCQDQKCEVRIKEACGADLRVIPFDKQDLLKYPNCVCCKKKAFRVAVFAQAY